MAVTAATPAASTASADGARPAQAMSQGWLGALMGWLLPVLLVMGAAALRLPFPDLVPFGYDEALEALRARAIALGARPVANEVTSWWLPDPALMLYVYALAEGLPNPPIARIYLLGAINTLAVLLCYVWARRWFGPLAGLLAGLFYLANPWATYFGRQPWVNIQPLLTVLILIAAFRVVADRDRKWAIPFFAFLGLQTQTHLLGLLYLAPALVTLVLFPRRWAWWVIPGALVAAAICAPFGLHLWEQRETVLQALQQGGRSVAVPAEPTALRLTLWLLSGYQLESKLADGAAAFSSLEWPMLAALVLSAVLLGLGLIQAILACLTRRPDWDRWALVLIWFAVPLAVSALQNSAVYIHYMIVLVPLPFLLMAAPLAQLGRLGRAPAIFALAIAVSLAAVQIAATTSLYRSVEAEISSGSGTPTAEARQARLNELERETRRTGIGDLMGLPLRYWLEVSQRTRAEAQRLGISEITVPIPLSDPSILYVDRRRMALDYLLGVDMAARFPLEGTLALPVRSPSLYLLVPGVELPRAARSAEKLFSLPLPGTRDETRLSVLPPRPAREQASPRRRRQARFSSGVELLGFDAPTRVSPGESMLITTYWLFDELSPQIREREHNAFFHLLDRSGAIVAQEDGLGLPSYAWRSGEVIIRRTTLRIPTETAPGEYQPVVGLYEQATLQRVAVLTDPGGAGVDRVSLDPVSVRS